MQETEGKVKVWWAGSDGGADVGYSPVKVWWAGSDGGADVGYSPVKVWWAGSDGGADVGYSPVCVFLSRAQLFHNEWLGFEVLFLG